jgi:hypothetical protein
MSDISIVGVPGLPEITPGANLAELIVAAATDLGTAAALVGDVVHLAGGHLRPGSP